MLTTIAKLARMGNEIIIVNCEEGVLSGSRENVLKETLQVFHRGTPEWGPYPPVRPDRVVRRMVRNMVDYKSVHGNKDYKRIKTFIGVPEEYAKEISKEYKFKKSGDLVHNRYVKLGDMCRQIGAKW
ncbi:50S ribosomal protein L13 [Candidatus Tiddalikarchaeum anstoanum]|nr:50S ribosomal protein L13 [Candidatus Tiddalikarchaeum anstoanum]